MVMGLVYIHSGLVGFGWDGVQGLVKHHVGLTET